MKQFPDKDSKIGDMCNCDTYFVQFLIKIKRVYLSHKQASPDSSLTSAINLLSLSLFWSRMPPRVVQELNNSKTVDQVC